MEGHGSPDSAVEVEPRGLSIYTHHGVTDAEQEVGQRLEFDLAFDVPDCDAVLTDRVEDTVDYAEVCDIVALAATERSYRTLERLCQVVAERLMERFDCESIRVRGQAGAPVSYRVDEAGVEVTPGARVRARARRRGRGRLSDASRGGVGHGRARPRTCEREQHLRRAVADLAEHGVGVEAVSSIYETEPVGEILDQPDSSTPLRASRPNLEPRRCSTSARRSRSSTAVPSPVPATGPGRSTSTCCCWATSSSRASGLDAAAPRGDLAALRADALLELDPELALPDGTVLRDALDSLDESQRCALLARW